MPILNEDQTLREINKGLSNSIDRVWITSPWVSTWIIDRNIAQKDARLVVRLSDKSDIRITDFDVLRRLNNNGTLKIRCHSNLHSKMYIFDNFCIIGSSNLTSRGMGKSDRSNRETSVLIDSKDDLLQASERFLEIWEDSIPINECKFSSKTSKPRIRGPMEILKLFKPHNPFERFRRR